MTDNLSVLNDARTLRIIEEVFSTYEKVPFKRSEVELVDRLGDKYDLDSEYMIGMLNEYVKQVAHQFIKDDRFPYGYLVHLGHRILHDSLEFMKSSSDSNSFIHYVSGYSALCLGDSDNSMSLSRIANFEIMAESFPGSDNLTVRELRVAKEFTAGMALFSAVLKDYETNSSFQFRMNGIAEKVWASLPAGREALLVWLLSVKLRKMNTSISVRGHEGTLVAVRTGTLEMLNNQDIIRAARECGPEGGLLTTRIAQLDAVWGIRWEDFGQFIEE
jgi:hypothetical protein